jgi:hypothetical protein
MPVTSAGWGPATVGLDADKITYCVWDKLFNEHGSFDNLYDAINEAMRLNHEDQHSPTGKGETNPLKDRGKMIKPFPGAPAGGYPLTPNPAESAEATPVTVEKAARVLLANTGAFSTLVDVAETEHSKGVSFNCVVGRALRALAGEKPNE